MAQNQPARRPPQSATQQVVITQVTQQHVGPLPSPQVLEGYEKVLKGGADRIFSMAEREQLHRHQSEKRQVWLNSFHVSLGQILAFIVLAGGTGGGLFLLYHDKRVEGLTTFITALGSIIGVFIYSKWSDKKTVVAQKKVTPPQEPPSNQTSS